MRLQATQFCLVGILLAPISHAASISVFSDSICGSCNASIAGSGSGTLYIMASGIEGTLDLCGGITGAEFRVAGLPSDWTSIAVPSSEASVAFGDPFGSGAIIAFPQAQFGDCVLLYTVMLSPPSNAGEVVLNVLARDPPSNPSRSCPVLIPPDCPVQPICVPGGHLFVNSSQTCNVAVDATSWQAVKAIFR